MGVKGTFNLTSFVLFILAARFVLTCDVSIMFSFFTVQHDLRHNFFYRSNKTYFVVSFLFWHWHLFDAMNIFVSLRFVVVIRIIQPLSWYLLLWLIQVISRKRQFTFLRLYRPSLHITSTVLIHSNYKTYKVCIK